MHGLLLSEKSQELRFPLSTRGFLSPQGEQILLPGFLQIKNLIETKFKWKQKRSCRFCFFELFTGRDLTDSYRNGFHSIRAAHRYAHRIEHIAS
jgi:hypothetical protein